MLQGIEQIFDNITEMITGLKRTTYQEKFETFQAEYGYYFEEMSAYMKETENHEAAAEAVGIRLMHAAEKKCGNRRGKLDGRTRSELSLFMVYYIFPSILKQGVIKFWVLLPGENNNRVLNPDNINTNWRKTRWQKIRRSLTKFIWKRVRCQHSGTMCVQI